MTRLKKTALTALVALALLSGGLVTVASTEPHSLASQIAGSKGAETFGRESPIAGSKGAETFGRESS